MNITHLRSLCSGTFGASVAPSKRSGVEPGLRRFEAHKSFSHSLECLYGYAE